MIQHRINITMTVHDNGFVDVGVEAPVPAHMVEMALAGALAAVQREVLAARLGQGPQRVVLARPNGLPGPPI